MLKVLFSMRGSIVEWLRAQTLEPDFKFWFCHLLAV